MSETSEFQKGYSLDEIEKIRKEKRFKFEYTLADAILFLLYADEEPIKGKTKQMKEVFLTLNQVLPREKTQPVEFAKRQFGPYSEYVNETIDHLIFTNRISTIGKKAKNNVAIKIAPKGALYIQEKFKKLPIDTQNLLRTKRKEWESHIPSGILNLVYRDNKEYLENAILKKRYKPLDWSDTTQTKSDEEHETEVE
ncbi:MAG: hypothetical protein KGI19_07225 [Thaumarchaeota archaeon]|nr:hypothetical protein [Nitrososphaerota archaeon]